MQTTTHLSRDAWFAEQADRILADKRAAWAERQATTAACRHPDPDIAAGIAKIDALLDPQPQLTSFQHIMLGMEWARLNGAKVVIADGFAEVELQARADGSVRLAA